MKHKIKIAHIVQSLGGVDTSLRMITKYLDDSKFELILVKDRNENCPIFKSRSGKIINTFEVDFGREINPFKDLLFFIKILRILSKENVHLIHAHSAKCGALGRVAGFLLGIPTLITPQAFSYLSAESKTKRKVFILIEKFLKHFGGKILACSESEKARAINDLGYKNEDVLVFPNSLPLVEKTDENFGLEIADNEKYICTIGRPSYQKNTLFLIEVLHAMKILGNNSKLIILGVGHYSPDLNKIKEQISDLGLQNNVLLIPWSSREDSLKILSNALLYISLSRYEGLPFAVLEAMRAGKPCVVSNVDGNKDCIIDGINGYLVKLSDSPDGIANKVNNLINSRKVLERFGKKSYEIFENKFNIEVNIQGLEEIYKDVL